MNRWRQTLWITLAAAAVFGALRWLPRGSTLSHMDFLVEGRAAGDWCDPGVPQFVPAIEVRSPVALAVSNGPGADAPRANAEGELRFVLRTAGGKVIFPGDLAIVHEHRLHLLAIDPSLSDYSHLHPAPVAGRPGEWSARFTPRGGGTYRFFADFMPVATGRGLYASADVAVEGTQLASAPDRAMERQVGGARIRLRVEGRPGAGGSAELGLEVLDAASGEPAVLAPVMGAAAHLVAFDARRTGFAHLHPRLVPASAAAGGTPAGNATPPAAAVAAGAPGLSFSLSVPRRGSYLVWAQCAPAGVEVLAPFWIEAGAD